MELTRKIILGTAQLGLNYGVNNKIGKPTITASNNLLFAAFSMGIRFLDTAEAYGNAQEVIGTYHLNYPNKKFDVITKYNSTNKTTSAGLFRDNFLNNLEILQLPYLDSYLFHNFDSYSNFSYWNVLFDLVHKGKLNNIGISIYTNKEAQIVAYDDRIKTVQMPFNLLDNLSQRKSSLELLKQQGKIVHARSVFLQGLFFKDRTRLGYLTPLKSYLDVLDKVAIDASFSIEALALSYVLAQPLIDKIVIGVDDVTQLDANLNILSKANDIKNDFISKIDSICVDNNSLLNPTNWV